MCLFVLKQALQQFYTSSCKIMKMDSSRALKGDIVLRPLVYYIMLPLSPLDSWLSLRAAYTHIYDELLNVLKDP